MSSYITTHNSKGEAIFSDKVTNSPPKLAFVPGRQDLGYQQIIYDSDILRPDLSHEGDIDTYAERRHKGYPQGQIGPANGPNFGLVTMCAGGSSPFHRTMTLDAIYVTEGEVELHLDSGEMKVVKAGDSVVQRGTMHKWVNVTPNGGQMKMVTMAQPIANGGPIVVGGEKLETEWKARS
ncbi:cupin domain-containing protein [Dothistroma septosporum NZE10]|uniref:Cupin domain-containing protein n=1 Tax=Dothistroma septosporum (strain NZE10 / CBS 128990) TaxID=675120 RepID=M2WJB9_DOTSN|nr:cupin domain-containing protein [Dothistroma septosporum NZE10]